jgi:hypothetical protein
MNIKTGQNVFLPSNFLPSNAKTTLMYNFFNFLGTLLELCDPQSNQNKLHAKENKTAPFLSWRADYSQRVRRAQFKPSKIVPNFYSPIGLYFLEDRGC